MTNIQKTTIEFLSDIMRNNNKEWFSQNRNRYDNARKNFEIFVQELIDEIAQFDPGLKGLGVKSCVYRFNRDIRFSNDKSLYKNHFGAFMVKGGKKFGDRYAGYYFHIEPGKSMIAGGAYMPPPEWLKGIRERIDENPEEINAILNDKNFKQFFGTLDGEKLKTAPKGFPKDHPSIELLKYKSYLAFSEVTDKKLLEEGFIDFAVKAFKAMKPLNDFLNDY